MKDPKIRFKGFKGEWVETPLLDVVTLYNGLTYTPNDIRDHGTLVLRSSNVQEGEISLFDNVYVRSEVATSPNVKKGDIIVVVRNGSRTLIGKHAQIKSDMPNTVIGAFMAGIHTDEPEFLNALLCTRRFENEVTINLGATINQITNGTFHSMKFLFPDKKEQKALGYYFQHLDSLIQSTTKKIESLKQVKAESLQSMFPQEGETTPRVRFKGFEGEWEETPFSETFDYLKNNSLSRAELSDGGVVMNIHYGDVLIKYGECVDVGKEVKTFVKEEQVAKRLHQSCAITNGDIIFADAAEDNTVGKCSEIIAKEDDAIISGLHTIPCRPMKQFATRYLGYYLNSNAYHNQLLPHIQGTKISSISKKAMSQTHINSPLDIAEQRAIASYFTNLDRQITLQTQRLEKLKQIKSACLDNMFV